MGATLVFPLHPLKDGHSVDLDAAVLLERVKSFRRRIDEELPNLYAWFTDASLHVTLRALIN